MEFAKIKIEFFLKLFYNDKLMKTHTRHRGVVGGGGTPVHPLGPLEPEVGFYILNLHIYSDFFLFL